jgi:hypothetical protein
MVSLLSYNFASAVALILIVFFYYRIHERRLSITSVG